MHLKQTFFKEKLISLRRLYPNKIGLEIQATAFHGLIKYMISDLVDFYDMIADSYFEHRLLP